MEEFWWLDTSGCCRARGVEALLSRTRNIYYFHDHFLRSCKPPLLEILHNPFLEVLRNPLLEVLQLLGPQISKSYNYRYT